MKRYTYAYAFMTEGASDYTIKRSQGDGWVIRTQHGYIDYRHNDDEDTNEIWWVESHKKDHGSELIDLMQLRHPANNIAWGATSIAGERLMHKWHESHPDVLCITGDHEGQYNPFDHEEEYDEEEYDQDE